LNTIWQRKLQHTCFTFTCFAIDPNPLTRNAKAGDDSAGLALHVLRPGRPGASPNPQVTGTPQGRNLRENGSRGSFFDAPCAVPAEATRPRCSPAPWSSQTQSRRPKCWPGSARASPRTSKCECYRVTSLIRNTHPVGPYSSPMSRDLW
jgi:hypothetical protein